MQTVLGKAYGGATMHLVALEFVDHLPPWGTTWNVLASLTSHRNEVLSQPGRQFAMLLRAQDLAIFITEVTVQTLSQNNRSLSRLLAEPDIP